MVSASSSATSPSAAPPEHQSKGLLVAVSEPTGNALRDKIEKVRKLITKTKEYNAGFVHPPRDGKTLRVLTSQQRQKLHQDDPIGPLVITDAELTRLDKLYDELLQKSIAHNRVRQEDEQRLQSEKTAQTIKEAKDALRDSCPTITAVGVAIVVIGILFKTTLGSYLPI